MTAMKMSRFLYAIIGLSFTCSSAVYAAPGWKIKAGVDASEAYNSNITLGASSVEVDDSITQINPYVSVTRKSGRLDLTADYRVQNIIYAGQSKFNKTYHRFNGLANTNLVKDLFYIKGLVNLRQQNINANSKVSNSNTSITGNRTNTGTATLNPYLKFRFGRVSNLLVGYERGIVRYSSGTVKDSDRNNYQMKLSSGKSFTRFKWSADYRNQDIQTEGRPDISIEKYSGSLQYKLTRQFSIIGTAGYENNDYTRSVTSTKPQGSVWTVGSIWHPSRLTTVEVRVGKRFFGNTAFMKLTQRGRRASVSANYSEDITVSSATQYNNRGIFNAGSGAVAPRPFTDSITTNISTPTLNNDTFIRKRFAGDFSFNTKKSFLKVSVFDERRLYQNTLDSERVSGVSGIFDWNFAIRNKAFFSATGQIRRVRGTSQKDGQLYLRAGIERKMRKKLKGRLYLTHNRRETSSGLNDFRQNIVAVSIDWLF